MTNLYNLILTGVIYILSLAALLTLALIFIMPAKKINKSDINYSPYPPATNHRSDKAKVVYGDIVSWRYLRETIFEIQGERCLCCGKKTAQMHIDHIKPKSRYPHLQYMIDNLQVLCPDCNRHKSNTREIDYRKSDHLIALIREINKNKLLRRRYVYDFGILEDLAVKRFNAELKDKIYAQELPIA